MDTAVEEDTEEERKMPLAIMQGYMTIIQVNNFKSQGCEEIYWIEGRMATKWYINTCLIMQSRITFHARSSRSSVAMRNPPMCFSRCTYMKQKVRSQFCDLVYNQAGVGSFSGGLAAHISHIMPKTKVSLEWNYDQENVSLLWEKCFRVSSGGDSWNPRGRLYLPFCSARRRRHGGHSNIIAMD